MAQCQWLLSPPRPGILKAVTGHSLTRMPPRLKSESAASSAIASAAPRGPPGRRALPGRRPPGPQRPGAEEAEAGGPGVLVVPRRIAEARAVAGNLNLKLGAQQPSGFGLTPPRDRDRPGA
jgi:hypothetical protein